MGKISSPPGFDPRTAIDELNNSKVKFWLEQFRSGRVGANDYHRDRDGGLIKETKKNSLPCHFTHRDVGTTRFFTSKNLTNNIRPEDVNFYLKACISSDHEEIHYSHENMGFSLLSCSK